MRDVGLSNVGVSIGEWESWLEAWPSFCVLSIALLTCYWPFLSYPMPLLGSGDIAAVAGPDGHQHDLPSKVHLARRISKASYQDRWFAITLATVLYRQKTAHRIKIYCNRKFEHAQTEQCGYVRILLVEVALYLVRGLLTHRQVQVR